MVSSTIQEVFYTGNASSVTSYTVPFVWTAETQVKAQRLDAGTGTVTVVSGVATFSSAQSTLGIGSHVRIAGITYTIHEKTSTTVFQFTDEASISASSFHLPDDAVALVEGSTFTLSGVSGSSSITTNPAIAASALLRVYRELPLTQLASFPSTGPFPTEAVELALDTLEMQIQQLATQIQNSGIVVPEGNVSANDTTTFADTAARTAATPSRIGQVGIQLDTAIAYYGTAVSAGSWTSISVQASQYHVSSVAGLTPAFVGQLAVIGTSGGEKANTLWRGTATTLGSWDQVDAYRQPFSFTYIPWPAGDPLVVGQRRWAGNIPLTVYQINEAFVSCNTAGTEDATVKVHIANNRYTLTDSNITLTPEQVGSGILDSGDLSDAALDTQDQLSSIEVEIVTVGEAVTVTSVGGSAVSTPASAPVLGELKTGRALSTIGVNENGLVVAVRGDGSVLRSHPAVASGSESLYLGNRIFVRGVPVSLAGGVTTIPALTADLDLIVAGDPVIGPTVQAGTIVTSKDASNFYINQPLTGATTLVTVINETRSPVYHFMVISEAAAQTVIGVPTTSGLRVGDRVFGLYVPTADSGAYITAIDPGVSFTISSAISGGTATEITVRPPNRIATVSAGTTGVALNHSTGLLIGYKVHGAGVPNETYITSVSSPNIVLSNAVTLALAGAATDLYQFTREKIQITGTVNGTDEMTLPYAVSATPVEAGMAIVGPGLAPGTLVESVAGSIVTLNKAAVASAVSQLYQLYAAPADWSGLQLTLTGFVTKLNLV